MTVLEGVPHPIVSRYCEIVRGNNAVQAVVDAILGDEEVEIIWGLIDAAIDAGLVGRIGPNSDEAFDQAWDKCHDLLPAVLWELSK